MQTLVAKDGYEKIEAEIQSIENLAWEGVFSGKNTTSKFHQIVSETKKLRQILRDVFFVDPNQRGGDAA